MLRALALLGELQQRQCSYKRHDTEPRASSSSSLLSSPSLVEGITQPPFFHSSKGNPTRMRTRSGAVTASSTQIVRMKNGEAAKRRRSDRKGTQQDEVLQLASPPNTPVTRSKRSRPSRPLDSEAGPTKDRLLDIPQNPPTPDSLPRAKRNVAKVTAAASVPVAHEEGAGPSEPRRKRRRREAVVEISSLSTPHPPVISVTPHRRSRETKNGTTAKKRGTKGSSAKVGHEDGSEEGKLLARSEKGVLEHVGKIHLIQERLRYDPWKMLVATSLLNKTSGRAARPVLWVLLERWPTPQALAEASIPDLSTLLYPLGLFNQRAASLVRFSRQYLDLGWPEIVSSASRRLVTKHDEEGIQNGDTVPLPVPSLSPGSATQLEVTQKDTKLDVKVFHGSGTYASDSFRIYSPLLAGRGGPEKEDIWLQKRTRAIGRIRSAHAEHDATQMDLSISENEEQNQDGYEGDEDYEVNELGDYISDEDCDDSKDEWRSVIPNDKELRRYLIWRWGIEGIVYDIERGPKIWRERDIYRLRRDHDVEAD